MSSGGSMHSDENKDEMSREGVTMMGIKWEQSKTKVKRSCYEAFADLRVRRVFARSVGGGGFAHLDCFLGEVSFGASTAAEGPK